MKRFLRSLRSSPDNKSVLGFTLLEMLIIMMILAILTAVFWGNFNTSLIKSRDSRRKENLAMIKTALEMYHNDLHTYPSPPLPIGQSLVNPFNSSVIYMQNIPADLSSGVDSCYESDGTYYKIYSNLENKDDPNAYTGVLTSPCNTSYNYGIASPNVLMFPETHGQAALLTMTGQSGSNPSADIPPTAILPTSIPLSGQISVSVSLPSGPTEAAGTAGCSYTLNTFWGIRASPNPPMYPDGWFIPGSGDGQFNYPISAAIDASGNILVSDSSNYRIQKLTSDGVFITKWGSHGTDSGQFNMSKGIAVDKQSGSVYVLDGDYSWSTYFRVEKFDANGNFIKQWGIYGNGPGQFNRPQHLTVDSSGNVYVSDLMNQRIQKFDSNGNYLTQWGSSGSGNGQFINPRGIAVDTNGLVYVADSGNHRIQIFDQNGTFISKFGSECETHAKRLFVCVTPTPNPLGGIGSGCTWQLIDNPGYQPCEGQFFWPGAVYVDSDGNIFVLDGENNRVQKFDSNKNLVTAWGEYAATDGTVGAFRSPTTLTLDPAGNVYVTDMNRANIQKFSCTSNP